MKKAYVKPVFFAEEFEGTVSVAACVYHADTNPAQIWEGMYMCANEDNGHAIGGQNKQKGDVQQWWGYATNTSGATDANPSNGTYNDGAYLFTDNSVTCDFVWNDKGAQVGIWTSKENDTSSAIWKSSDREGAFVTLISMFTDFFFGNDANFEGHTPVYEKMEMFS